MKSCKLLLLASIVLLCACNRNQPQHPGATVASPPFAAVPKETVRFANLPYGDHTYSEIGVEEGFFDDVNIDFKPEMIKIDEVVADLANGRVDAASVPPGILFSSYDTAPELRTFVFGDLFQGYALMTNGNSGFKTYEQFRASGLEHDAAVAATVRQIVGHTFAYPTETAIKPFIDLLLQRGGVSRSSFKALVLDDPLTVNALRRGQAQFQVGGVPSRITLQKEGFIPLISSVDLARGAKPSADSPELASILQNGWATTAAFYTNHHPTILRLASVNYRIMKFIATNPDEAGRIHMAYLSRVTGTPFTAADSNVIYKSLDPFVTFEDQRPWFHDTANPLYYAYVNGAILNSFKAAGIYHGKTPNVEDVIFADDVYRELEGLQAKSTELLAAIAPIESTLSPEASAKLKSARRFFNIYDFYDSKRILQEVPH